MKIVFVTEFFPATTKADVRGGVEQRTWQISQAIAASQQVEVIATRENGQPAVSTVGRVTVFRPGPTATYGQSGGAWARWQYLWAARRILRQRQADVIVLENFVAYAIGLVLTSAERTRCYVTYHDVWLGSYVKHLGLFLGLAGELIERLALRKTWRGILANSQYTAENVRRALRRPNPVHVVYNGLQIDGIREISPERFSQPTIVTVARLVKYKRIDDLIRALRLVRQTIPAVRLVVIGSGPMTTSWKKLGDNLGQTENIEWRGFVPDHHQVLAAIKGAAVFCLPSAVEGYGFVSLEAMACGTPYVNSDIPATREVTNGGLGGKLYPVGDVTALATALTQTLQQPRPSVIAPEVAQQIGRYNWSDIIRQFTRLLEADARTKTSQATSS